MKDLEEARVEESQKQIAFCFDTGDCLEQQPISVLSNIRSLSVLSLGPNKVVAFPSQKKTSVDAVLLARILQRMRLFK